MRPRTYVVIVSVSLPHILYAFVWVRPDIWMKIFGKKRATRALSIVANVLKVIQFTAAIAYYMVHDATTPKVGMPWQSGTYREGRFVEGPNPWIRFFLGAMGPRQAFPGVAGLLIGLAGFALIAYGQVLNGAVFHKLGEIGVYYGVRFGHEVEWVEGFPFNHMSHAQYVGSVLTIWGPVLVLADFCNVVEMAKLTLFWTLCYFTTAVAEDYGEHKAHEEAEKED